MSFDRARLFALLPSVYRNRDRALAELAGYPEGPLGHPEGPLEALLAVVGEQLEVLEEDLAQLYDDQFIETCAEWVVPYIGDLVGARGLFVFSNAGFSERALVANTVGARQSKGTAASLEEIARGAGGWPTHVTEYFTHLAATQYMNHLRPENVVAPNLRDRTALETIGTPFDRVARTFEARRIQTGRGRYNIPNIGVHVWRLQAFAVTRAPAFMLDAHRGFFDPLGRDRRLVTRPEPETGISHRSTRLNVPEPIGRWTLKEDVARANAKPPEEAREPEYYGAGKSILVTIDGTDVPVDAIEICNLEDIGYDRWACEPGALVRIDPVLGRIVTRVSESGAEVRVTYQYTFSAPMGGGEYARGPSFTPKLGPPLVVTAPATIQQTLDTAGGGGAVEIPVSDRHIDAPAVIAAAQRQLELRAAEDTRTVLFLDGAMTLGGHEDAEVILNGLWIAGGLLRVPRDLGPQTPNRLRTLRLRHCTLVPGAIPGVLEPGESAPIVSAQAPAPRLHIELPGVNVEIDDCVIAGVRAVGGARVQIRNSIVDAGTASAIAYAGLMDHDAGARLRLLNSTVIGKVRTTLIELASNSIFLSELGPWDWWEGPVLAERLQQGCVRYSYVPPGSQVPRRYRCVPAQAADDGRLRPVFTSREWGEPGYCQLSGHTAREIREGADDGSEMGAFHDVFQPQRLANIRARIDEYLRFGLEGGVLFAS